MPFKCDLNLAVSTITVCEWWSWTPLPVLFHMNTLWWVWKNVLICWVIFSSLLSCFDWVVLCVCVGNNLRMQATKPIFFSAAYEGL